MFDTAVRFRSGFTHDAGPDLVRFVLNQVRNRSGSEIGPDLLADAGPDVGVTHAQSGPESVRVSRLEQSEIGPDPAVRIQSGFVQDRRPPPLGGTVGPNRDHDSMARWRHSQRHLEAKANWAEIESAWTWLTTPLDQQRAICTATHKHIGRCPARHGHPRP